MIFDIVNIIYFNMDNRKYLCGIFIDFKKVFDIVNYEIFLIKFEYYGIRGVINFWFRLYFLDC